MHVETSQIRANYPRSTVGFLRTSAFSRDVDTARWILAILVTLLTVVAPVIPLFIAELLTLPGGILAFFFLMLPPLTVGFGRIFDVLVRWCDRWAFLLDEATHETRYGPYAGGIGIRLGRMNSSYD